VTAVVAVSAIGGLLALFSIDSTRAVIVNVRASLGGGAPVQFGAAESEPAQAAAQLPPRVAAPAAPEPAAALPDPSAARRTSPTTVTIANALATASPSRDEITAAYQSAIKGKVAVPEPVAREAAREAAPVVPAVRETAPPPRDAVPARRIDPDELAALLKRAKGLLAIGDITSARLLLERAADAQEPEAALMLAGTYDPQVLGSQDLRSVTPDPAAARVWYQKAAQLGSADAKRRLGQLQN
jgi:TPR repeat protein